MTGPRIASNRKGLALYDLGPALACGYRHDSHRKGGHSDGCGRGVRVDADRGFGAVPQDSCCQSPLSGAAGSPFPDPRGFYPDRW